MTRPTIHQRRFLSVGLVVVLVAIASLVVVLMRQGDGTALRSVDTPASVEAEAPSSSPIPPDQIDRAVTDDDQVQADLDADLDDDVPSEAEVPLGAADLDADAAELADDSRDPYFEEQVTDGE